MSFKALIFEPPLAKKYTSKKIDFDLLKRSPEEILLYSNGISEIRKKYEEIYKDFKGKFDNGFTSWPGTNPHFNRSPNDLLISISFLNDEVHSLGKISTPLGEVMLTGSGFGDALHEFALRFLSEIDWEIQDVTQRIENYDYVQENGFVYGPRYFPKNLESYEGAGDQMKIYRIKRVGDIFFPTPKQIIRLPNPCIKSIPFSNIFGSNKEKKTETPEEESKPIIPRKPHQVEIKVISI